MTRYVLLDKYSEELSADFAQGFWLDDNFTQRYLIEKAIYTIDAKLKVSIYSNEIEPPHFKVEYQGESCRFRLSNGEPMDAMGTHISKYHRNIKKFYRDKKNWLCEIYNDNLPSNAPPQARINL